MAVVSCESWYLYNVVVVAMVVALHAQEIVFPDSSSTSPNGINKPCVLPSGATAGFRGPYDKIWNDHQCANGGRFYGASLSECKSHCSKTFGCSAFNYMIKNHPDTRLSHDNSSCVLRTCTKPVPQPEWSHHPYQGYIINTEVIHVADISPPTVNFECGKANPAPPRPVSTTPGPAILVGSGVLKSDRNEWPWMAVLGRDVDGNRSWFCSGMLINPEWVLTAAHCPNRINVTWVRLGEHDFSNDNNVEDVGVAEVVYHPCYQLPEEYHDIALIRLATPIKLRREISPVCLPWGRDADLPLEGNTVTITGWGARRFGGGYTRISEVPVTVFQTDVCANSYSKLIDYAFKFPQGLGEESLCIGDDSDQGNDSCQGASGGPAVLPKFDQRGLHWTLIGIISTGFGCGKKDFPGIYVKVQYPEHLAWIKKVAF